MQRYELAPEARRLVEADDGPWVFYADVEKIEARLAEALELLQATWGMGFYFVDEDSGETHRDVSKRVEALLKALAGQGGEG